MTLTVPPARRFSAARCSAPILAWVWGLVLVSGCSTGEYERNYQERLEAYRREAKFVDFNRDPTTLGEGVVKVRLPRSFSRAAPPAGPKERPRPLFIRGIPGVLAAFEADATVDGQPAPGVVAIGFQPEGRTGQIEEVLFKHVAANPALAQQKLAWQKQDLDHPDAAFRNWSVLRFKADDLCEVGTPPRKVPGRAELWVSAVPRQPAVVVLAWLVPEQAAGALGLDTLAGLTAGTVATADAEPAAPQPDPRPAAGNAGNARP